MNHRRRIAALERRFAPDGTMPTLIRITGGLPDDGRARATVDSQELKRDPNEAAGAFAARVLQAARAVRQQFVFIGGLPD